MNVTQLTEHKELLERNYKLMQLKDVDIPGSTKLLIQDIVSNSTNRLVKYKLHSMFLEDTINQAIRNPDVWLQSSFNKLELILENDSNK
jgi:hypothetical protein